MSRYDGGPAFPRRLTVGEARDGMRMEEGMTLRDYFAAKAAVGYMHGWGIYQEQYADWARHAPPSEKIAEMAYAVADAMLAERANDVLANARRALNETGADK